jgi:S-adenosylmethionine-dependent methyltransferase
MAFGEHLHEVRRRRGLRGACVTSPLPPPLPRSGLCRLPHLTTAEGPDETWRDAVVWEVMTAERFRAWLGRDPVSARHSGCSCVTAAADDPLPVDPPRAGAPVLVRIPALIQGDTLTNSWLSASGGDLSAGYARHTGTLRGAARHALVARALRTHLPTGPQQVLDVGGGDGHQAAQLARIGHQVTVLDPDSAMLARARERLAAESVQVQQRIRLVQGSGHEAADLVGGGYDLVLCHGVLMYVEAPEAFVGDLVAAARSGGLVSLLVKNRDALAMRPGLEGRWADALDVMNAHAETGTLGVTSRAHTTSDIDAMLAAAGASTVTWYGVRVFTDHLGDAPVGDGFDTLLNAEWEAGRRDPYRRVARLLHFVARATPQETP